MTTSFDFTAIMPYSVPFTPQSVGSNWGQIVEKYRRFSSPTFFWLDEGTHLIQADWPGGGQIDINVYIDGVKIDLLEQNLPAGERTMPPMRVTAVAGKRGGGQAHRDPHVDARRYTVGAHRWSGRHRDNYTASALRYRRPHHDLIHAGGVR